MTKPMNIDYAVYIHGPSSPLFTYTAGDILETIAEIWCVYTEFEIVDKTGAAEKLAFKIATRKCRDKNWLLMAHPETRKAVLVENIQAKELPILGRIVAIDWFGYRTYEDYVRDLKSHIELGLEDDVPMAVMVNSAPPTSLPYPRPVPPGFPGKSYTK